MNLRNIRYSAAMLGAALCIYALLMNNARIATAPHAGIISFLYGYRFVYDPAIGYLSPEAGIAITPGCMGATLFVAAFLILSLGSKPVTRRLPKLCLYGAASLAGALCVSVLRIALSLPFVPHPKAQLIHNLLSYLLYFGALLALYVLMQRRKSHEQVD